MNKKEKIARAEKKHGITIIHWDNESGIVTLLKDGLEHQINRHSLKRSKYSFRTLTWKGQRDWYNREKFAGTQFEVIEVDKQYIWIKSKVTDRVTRQPKADISLQRADLATRC